MKTVLRNIFTRVISVVLSAVMIISCAMNVFAAEEKSVILYVKDVKLILQLRFHTATVKARTA